MRKTSIRNTCRVQGCTGEAGGRNLFCPRHWQFLPERLRAAILGAKGNPVAMRQARGDAQVWYCVPENRAKADAPPRAAPYVD